MDGLPTAKLELLVKGWGQGRLREEKTPSCCIVQHTLCSSPNRFENYTRGNHRAKEEAGKLSSPPSEGARGSGKWVFLRQLTLNDRGDILITVAIGPNQQTVTFLVDIDA